MRTVCAIAVLMTAVPFAAAQQPAEMVVSVPEVEVRSGPSPQFYATGKVRQGDRVQIVADGKAQPGWIAIRPPVGSFSWINAKHLLKQQNTQYAAVIGDEPAPVRPGSPLSGKAPDVESVKVKPGTIVLIVGKEQQSESGTWYPIAPPPQEVRYIPADAAKPAPLIAAAPTSAPTNPPPGKPAQTATNPNVPAQTTALYRTGTTTPPTATTTNLPAQWSVWGQLRDTKFNKDGLPMYVLENRQGQVLLYVTTAPGFSLRDYIGKTLALYGPVTYRSDDYMRVNYMVASHVATLPR